MTRRTLTVVVVGMLVAGAAAISMRSVFAQGAITADLILSNGKIVTVDDRFTIAQAVAIKGNRIVAVGANQEMDRLAAPNARRINLRGRTVIPGLIDNHNHLLRAATTWPLELRFDGVGTRKKAIEMIRARGKQVGPGQWVFNIGGWATAQFADDPKPFTREELDQIAPDNPVALQESYYQVFLNSRGLKAFGIEPNAPDPSDFVKGSIMRDAAGKPTGVIRGDIAATRPVAARLPKVPPDRLEASSSVARQGYESSRPHDVRRRRMQRRRAGHLQDMEVAGAPRCARLLHRRCRRGQPRAGGQVASADRTDEAVSGRRVHRRCGVRGERVHAAARPDVRHQIRSVARSARAVAAHGNGDRSSRPATSRACRAEKYDRRLLGSDRGGEQAVPHKESSMGPCPRQSDQRLTAREDEEAWHVRRRASLGRDQRRHHARVVWRRAPTICRR